MDPTDVRRWSAFTRDPEGGNPAGVAVLDALPSEAEMLAAAAAVGYSETAFLAPSDRPDADWDIRYFSPDREISFCGHATIASGVVLATDSPDLAAVTFATRGALVPVEVLREGPDVAVALTSPPTSVRPIADDLLDAVLATFGWTTAVLDAALPPPAVAEAGAAHLVLPVADAEVLAAMAYDYDALRAIMLTEGWTTVDVVRRRDATTFEARNPFPVGGVVEDPATGAAAAAFGAWLRHHGVVATPADVTVLQGHHMGRPGRLDVHVPVGATGIRVAGTAVPIA